MTSILDDDERSNLAPSAFRGFVEAVPFDLSISATTLGMLKAPAAAAIDAKERAELIKAVNAGEHLEIEFSAVTYRQLDGKPNRKFVRFATSRLSAIAKSGRRTPFLVDHAQFLQTARMGTVIESRPLVFGDHPDLAEGEVAFSQRIRAVKPRAVIGVLDGTIDRFSIGWRPTGKILCAVHRGVARKDCACWLGETVEVDGEKRIVEYEFTDAELVEVSAVNVPAVPGTKIDEVRAALAAEIDHYNGRRDLMTTMPQIAARLGVAATASESEMLTALDQREGRAAAELELARGRATRAEAELATERTALAAANAELATARAAAAGASIDAALAAAYTDGRLIRQTAADGTQSADPFEASLRKLGAVAGLEVLQAELATLKPRAPVGVPAIAGGPGNGGPSPGPKLSAADYDEAERASARQLGLSEEDLATYGPKGGK